MVDDDTPAEESNGSATVQLSKIRLRKEVHARLSAEAKTRGMTLNAVIAEHLERSVDRSLAIKAGASLSDALFALCEAMLAIRDAR